MKPTLLGPATICAEDSDKRSDACYGDSGGPLYDSQNQRLVGLTSYGDPICVSTSPGVYARISDSFSWIQFNVCLTDPTAGLCNDVIAPGPSAPTSKWCRDAEVQVTFNTDEFPEETVWYLFLS
jgi:secreted trypsin-like serine protease